MKFELPAELPATFAELDELHGKARAQINLIQARHAAGDELSADDVAELRRLVEAAETLSSARAEAADAERDHTEELNELLARAAGSTETAATEDATAEAEVDAEAEVIAEAEAVVEDAAEREVVTAAAKSTNTSRPVTFAGTGTGTDSAPAEPQGPGWQMVPGAPKYREGTIGFAGLAQALDQIKPGSRRIKGAAMTRHADFAGQVLAKLERDMPVVGDPHALVAAIEKATSEIPGKGKVTAESLTAAGGWCAPSQQLYDFCDVPEATDLLSVPEIAIERGGIRWPVEPDLTSIFESFQFFFTEPQLEDVDGNGNPTAVKNCVEIPCVDEFEEIRLNAIGYCIEAGILQAQGWPELIEWFLRSITQEHFRALSRRTILDIVGGSEAVRTINANSTVGGTSAVLNAIALMAFNLRSNKGLSRNATIEGIAPNWLPEAIRADLAMADGRDVKSVSDAEIIGWLTARNIALQFVGDWQTRDTGQPGHMDTIAWPGHVDLVLYPAGTWFRSLSPVIELGGLYPKEQLQVNRYTHVFHEDAIAVGKRCNRSVNLRVPFCANGGYGGPITVTCPSPTTGIDSGAPLSGAPVDGGQAGLPGSKTLTITGGPTGGTIPGNYDGDPFVIQWNSTATQAKTAIVAASEDLSDNDVQVTGGPLPGAALVITVPNKGSLAIGTHALTGGTTPTATLA